MEEVKDMELQFFYLGTLKTATNNFSDENKLGEGGFGVVYKGKLFDGQEIAVKKLSRTSGQGVEELKNEVALVAKLQHKNLVTLLGCCIEEKEEMLVFEYIPNTSLDTFLFNPIKSRQLDWETRYKIIKGIARGLLYLHEDSRLRIIHRDLKASNILLDMDMNPKISDFGLARLFGGDQTRGNTSHIAGTYGYMAPEYATQGQFSIKSDVYSFGVLVLEIVTSLKNSSFDESESSYDLLSYVWRHWNEGTQLELIDKTLRKDCPLSEVLRSIQMGLLCVQEDFNERPMMSSVVLMLNSDSITLPVPSPPPFYVARIIDTKETVLRTRTIPWVKVQWEHHRQEEATWELRDQIRKAYPHLLPEERTPTIMPTSMPRQSQRILNRVRRTRDESGVPMT